MVPAGPVIRAGPARGLRLVRADALGAPGQQRDGALGVAPVRVRQPDRDLGQPLPQVTLGRRSGLPRGLQDLVGVERASRPQHLVGQPGRLRAGQRQVIGHAFPGVPGPLYGVERTPERVAGPRVPRPASRIAVPRHRSGSGSASHPRNSVSNASGRSSCG